MNPLILMFVCFSDNNIFWYQRYLKTYDSDLNFFLFVINFTDYSGTNLLLFQVAYFIIVNSQFQNNAIIIYLLFRCKKG